MTFLGIGAVQLSPELHTAIQGHGYLAFTLFLISVAIEFVLICFRDIARRVPTNYSLLTVFTLCQAFYFAFVTSFYPGENVLAAAGMTAGMTAGITAYAFNTKTDFTIMGSLFVSMSIGLVMLCICSVFMTFAEWWNPVLAALLAVFYGLYLIYDTQLIAGGH